MLWGCISVENSSPLSSTEFVDKSFQNSPTPLIAATMTSSPYPTSTLTPTATKVIEPEGCLRPPDDYTRVQVNGHWLNVRTVFMLENAYQIYGGIIDISGPAITQGHYTDAEPLSFGTHSGGGVVDISVIDRAEWLVLYDEIDALIYALRVAGFAAWLREYGELNPGSPIHIHAVAIGDAELSHAAVDQLTGDYGYFRGYNGLPKDDGIPVRDGHNDFILCQWMLVAGYRDLRSP